MARAIHLASTIPLALLVACAPSTTAVAPPPAAPSTVINAEDVGRHVSILAHDSMRGRQTGSPEIEAAARYLAAESERMGLRPAGDDGTFFHAVPLQRRRVSAAVTHTANGSATQLESDAVIPVAGMLGLPATSRTSGSGNLIYAGHIADPEVTDELTPEDVSGAAVIVRMDTPEGVDPEGATPRMPIAMLFSPMSPASAVLVVADESQEGLWNYASGIANNGAIGPVQEDDGSAPAGPAFFLVSPEWVESVLGTADSRQPRTELGTFEYQTSDVVEQVEAWNVAAILPGRDPARAGQYVSVGAHYDHVGVGVPVEGDSIYNGADDNASGTAGLLAVADRLTSLPREEQPARSVLFLWYTAEEHGLLGSRAYTDAPTVPLDSIIVNINADMIGRNSPDSIFVVGAGRLSSELAGEVEAANNRLASPFVLDYSYDTPDHPERIFCRSDHYNFARFGIPIVFYTTGLHDNYHLPSDEIQFINTQKMARVGSMIGDLILTLANAADRPVIDQPVEQAGAECG